MQRILFTQIFLFVCITVFSQVPDAINYQAVVRDATGNTIVNQSVTFRVTILKGSETGSAIFSETHSVTTNGFGLVNLKIGKGQNKTGILDPGGWRHQMHFLKIEIDPEGGNNFILMGISQFLSVPFAFHALTVEEDMVDDADADPENELQTISLTGNDLTLSDGGGTITLPAGGSSLWAENAGDVFRNTGNVGIGTSTPEFKLSLEDDGGILAKGDYGSGKTLTTTGAGARLIWYPKNAAFRAGRVYSDNWDDINIGSYSVAMGEDCTASEWASVAIGSINEASEYYSCAIGFYNRASGTASVALGFNNTASGRASFAMGEGINVSSSYSAAFGCYNLGGISTSSIFEIGNGTGALNRSNALTVLKNGNTGIGTHVPTQLLHIKSTINPRILVEAPGNQAPELNLQRGTVTHAIYVNNYNDLIFYRAGDRVTFTENGNVGIGTTTPAGKLDVNGSIYIRGGLLHADYVFEQDYDLESIEEHARFMWGNKHLGALPKAALDETGNEIVEIGAHQKGLVEELEKAHIYLYRTTK